MTLHVNINRLYCANIVIKHDFFHSKMCARLFFVSEKYSSLINRVNFDRLLLFLVLVVLALGFFVLVMKMKFIIIIHRVDHGCCVAQWKFHCILFSHFSPLNFLFRVLFDIFEISSYRFCPLSLCIAICMKWNSIKLKFIFIFMVQMGLKRKTINDKC